MDTSINITSKSIQYIRGHVKSDKIIVEAFDTEPLAQGAIVNGILLNSTAFSEALEKLRVRNEEEAFKNIRISFGGNPGIIKTKRIPKLKTKEMRIWLQSEFEGSGEVGEELICDYAILEKNKDEGDLALLCALGKDNVKAYIDIFNELEISIVNIDIGLSCQIKAIDLMDETIGKTFIVLRLDGNNLDANLYINGVFVVNNNIRIIAEGGTAEMAAEVEQLISRMIQFNYTEKNEEPVSALYYSGFKDDEDTIRRLENNNHSFKIKSISEGTQENIVCEKEGFSLKEYLYATFNLIRE